MRTCSAWMREAKRKFCTCSIRTNHHLIGVKWVVSFSWEIPKRGIAAVPLLSGGLFKVGAIRIVAKRAAACYNAFTATQFAPTFIPTHLFFGNSTVYVINIFSSHYFISILFFLQFFCFNISHILCQCTQKNKKKTKKTKNKNISLFFCIFF